jgi:hypothetical protein
MNSTVINLFTRTGVANTNGLRSNNPLAPNSGNASSVLVEKPDWEDATLSRLKLLLDLKEGWDGFDAKPLDIDSAMFGLKILGYLLPKAARAPSLSPTNYGGLQFEWFHKEKELEVEIEAPYRVRVLFIDKSTDQEIEQAFDYEYGGLRDLLKRTLNLEESDSNASAAA